MTHTHFIGIGGTGLSAMARVLLERGETVSGSDRQSSLLSDGLAQAGARVFIGHAAQNVTGADIVVRSSAVPDDNAEVVAAQQAGIPVLKRVDYLHQLIGDRVTIGISGSHGKTTTTAMTAWMMTALNQRPNFIVGGQVNNLNANARAGQGQTFVIEADEYDYMFWGLQPTIAVVTNVEHDHPDCFPTPESFMQAFEGYVDRIVDGGYLVAYAGDAGSKQILAYAQATGKTACSYGLEEHHADYTARNLTAQPGRGYQFEAWRRDQMLAAVNLQVPGRHNVLNALAVLAIADLRGLNLADAALALEDFRGAGRRFDILGEVNNILIIDDYGHHPTEIAATLEATRSRYPQARIWAVWQPHTFSRSLQLLNEFGQAFGQADQVMVTDVYAARETAPEGFSMATLMNAIQHPAARHAAGLRDAENILVDELAPGDVAIVFSAGDATAISHNALRRLKDTHGN